MKRSTESKIGVRLRLKILGGGGAMALVLPGILALGCATEVREGSRQKGQAATLQASLSVPQAAFDAGALLYGVEWVSVGDRARVGADGQRAPISSSGSGTTIVGADARVGSIWSKGRVDLRDRAVVDGSVTSETGITQGNQVEISGSTTVGPLGALSSTIVELPSLPVAGGNVTVEPGQVRVLAPGKYQSLTVKSNAQVKLSKGDYQFSNVTFDTGSKLEVTESCEAVRLFVTASLLFRGQVIQPTGLGAGLGLVVGYLGTNAAHIEQPFQGDVIAPHAEVVIASAPHAARFFARRVRLQPDARVVAPGQMQGRPLSCAPEPATPPVLEPVALGPVPVLEAPGDLPDFLHWYYRMRKGHLALFGGVVHQIQGDGAITSAVIDELEDMRSEAEFGPALMLVHLIGAIGATNGEDYLTDLLEEPITAIPDEPEAETGPSRSAYAMEVAIRRAAIQVFGRDLTPSRETFLRQLMIEHSERVLRSAAIHALSREMNDAERDVLRSQILPDDEASLDRISPNDPAVATKLAAFMQKYETP